MEPLAYFKAKEIKNLSHMLEFSIGVNAWLELWSFPLILGQWFTTWLVEWIYDGYYVAYKLITLPCISFMFIEMKFFIIILV